MTTKSKTDKKNNLKENNPCWKGYEPIGLKKKDEEEVPNCVPEKSSSSTKKKS
ncbi:hypothetical protein ACSX1A_17065 [Pontibacter sp. MBLB2868]|uniref:hypothetical protein n=1 Tax=Pontibacter sp. MBLB2868 TaxID=3451555 RepID=UPI003F750E86